MKILIVCSGNAGYVSPFIKEQAEAVRDLGFEIDYLLIEGKGIWGYMKNYGTLRKKIRSIRPSLIHAHYGLSALLACLQFTVPVVSTYHGSDIHQRKNLLFSKMAMFLSKKNIVVSESLQKLSGNTSALVIPCGVDTSVFQPTDKALSRKTMGLAQGKIYLLFSSRFANAIKNYPLAKKAVDALNNPMVELIELNDYSRSEVASLLNAADAALLTSFDEGSPQFIKEAMSCNTPVVATTVGDVAWVFGATDGCYLSNFQSSDLSKKILEAIEFSQLVGKTEGRKRILDLKLDNRDIAEKLCTVYQSLESA